MKIDCTVKKFFFVFFFTAFTKYRLGLTFSCYYFSLSFSSQSNWYDMNAGNCNLLLIKTCCWAWLAHWRQLGALVLSIFFLSAVVFLSSIQRCLPHISLDASLGPLLDCTLFYITVSPPWRGKESPQGGNHCPQQPPHGGEDHHQ